MKPNWIWIVLAVILTAVSGNVRGSWGQSKEVAPSVLHIAQTQTVSVGSQNGFPTFLGMYKVLNGAKSPAGAVALTGTLSLKNYTPTFSEVLWELAYWQGECPADDINLTAATVIWSDIIKNPSLSDSQYTLNLSFPHPLPMTGCVGLYYGGGPLLEGKATMTADLDLTYQPMSSNPNTAVYLAGEYCFGQIGGCQNSTEVEGEAFAVPFTMMQPGHLLELYGNISDSTFDGTNNYGPLPVGSWGSENDFYLLPGGCGIFNENLDVQGFPNPAPVSTLLSWLPSDALHLTAVPQVDRIPAGTKGRVALQNEVQTIFSAPVKVNAGDCVLVVYGRTGNGATDNETQVYALMGP